MIVKIDTVMINKKWAARNPRAHESAIAEPLQLRWGSLLSVALILTALQRYDLFSENPSRIRLNKAVPLYLDSV